MIKRYDNWLTSGWLADGADVACEDDGSVETHQRYVTVHVALIVVAVTHDLWHSAHLRVRRSRQPVVVPEDDAEAPLGASAKEQRTAVVAEPLR